MQSLPQSEKLFLGGDGHIGTKADGYDMTHGGFGYGERNSGGVLIMDRAVAYDLMIVDSIFRTTTW